MKTSNKESERIVGNRSEMILTAHYPAENPKGSIEGITEALSQIGVFDEIKDK